MEREGGFELEFVRLLLTSRQFAGGKNPIFFSRPVVMIVSIDKKRYPLPSSDRACKKIPRFLWPMIYRSDNAIHDTTPI